MRRLWLQGCCAATLPTLGPTTTTAAVFRLVALRGSGLCHESVSLLGPVLRLTQGASLRGSERGSVLPATLWLPKQVTWPGPASLAAGGSGGTVEAPGKNRGVQFSKGGRSWWQRFLLPQSPAPARGFMSHGSEWVASPQSPGSGR